MLAYPDPEIQRQIIAEVIDLIMASCAERRWSIDATQPSTNNPDRMHVAHIRNKHGQAIGIGMAATNADAIAEAFRSAWHSAWGLQYVRAVSYQYL